MWLKEKHWTLKTFSLIQVILGCIIFSLLLGLVLYQGNSILQKTEKAKLRDLVENAYSIVKYYYQLTKNGTISEEKAQDLAKEAIRNIRYGPDGKDYFWITTDDPSHIILVMHPYKPQLEGKDVTKVKDKAGNLLFIEMAKVARKKGEGYVRYFWQYRDQANKIEAKLSYVKSFTPWHWIIGTGFYEKDYRAEIMPLIKEIIFASIAGVILYLVLSIFLANLLVRPVPAILMGLKELGKGNLKIRFKEEGVLEFKNITRTLNQTIDALKNIINNVRQEAELLAKQGTTMQEETDQVVNKMESSKETAKLIDKFAQKIVENIKEEEILMEQVSQAIQEIEKNTSHSSQTTSEAVEKAERTKEIMHNLNEMSKGVSGIVKLINDIADQTNLLALNATIEAARAGDAGKGFAVVANEVKELAKQTTKATEEITQKLNAIQQESQMAMKAVNEITEIITHINEGASSIASAIEEHTAIMAEVSQKIAEQSASGDEVREKMATIKYITEEASEILSTFYQDTAQLKEAATRLEELVAKFKV